MKEILKTSTLEFENKVYEIKLYRIENGYKVESFCDGQKVNPYSYSVNDLEGQNYEIYHGEKAYEKLIEVAKNDIREGLIYGKKL